MIESALNASLSGLTSKQTSTVTGNYVYNRTDDINNKAYTTYDDGSILIKTVYGDGSIGYSSDNSKAIIGTNPTPSPTGQKDAIDIILIAVSTLIIILSFTYLFFV